jgi:hypothetical protein
VGAFAPIFGILLIARPLLIDFQYGQINVALMAVCAITLFSFFENKSGKNLVQWMILAFLAWTKVFALPLLIIPFLKSHSKNKEMAQRGVAIGLLIALALPFLIFGFQGAIQIHLNWYYALQAKGLPLDSHNQSFVAFLFHLFTGEPTHIISRGSVSQSMGIDFMSKNVAHLFAWVWFVFTSVGLLYWITNISKQPKGFPLQWIAISIAGLIVPSYLVWKPYFVFSFLAGCYAYFSISKRKNPRWGLLFLFAVFAGINLSGFDFIGPEWGARFESGSIFLFMHLLLIAYCLKLKTAV